MRSGDRTVTTKELQWSATSAERRTFERDFQAERRAGLVRGFPNIAVLPDRPPNGLEMSRPASLDLVSRQSQTLGWPGRLHRVVRRARCSLLCGSSSLRHPAGTTVETLIGN